MPACNTALQGQTHTCERNASVARELLGLIGFFPPEAETLDELRGYLSILTIAASRLHAQVQPSTAMFSICSLTGIVDGTFNRRFIPPPHSSGSGVANTHDILGLQGLSRSGRVNTAILSSFSEERFGIKGALATQPSSRGGSTRITLSLCPPSHPAQELRSRSPPISRDAKYSCAVKPADLHAAVSESYEPNRLRSDFPQLNF